ncbi:VOC family protein [Croceivirga sp. JEA036]|uniref:VOC family protein n=1 Tax=Croceivirga sp. JEA036 TaxID=2721162 RepID=UPI00143CADC7|nr:VOC family protein [Croceivirga sp. JEA036]NJB37911.1 VOC family protein [Croceivirga sp. JEA036]
MDTLVGWFEIPVADMLRAQKFYEAVFNCTINVQIFGGTKMGWFPQGETKNGASGSLIEQPNHYQSSATDGVLIYFNSVDVQHTLDRIAKAGGKILKEKTLISPEIGFMGLFLDTEGNRIALHSRT